jgi:quercetin dioxygenase-like cupin family protein
VNQIATTTRLKATIDDLALVDAWCDEDPTMRVRFGAAFDASTGAVASTTEYIEVPAGHRTPWHTHSVEEVVYVVKGRAEAGVGQERVVLAAGDMALIPAHVPHGLESVGDEPLEFIGFFAAAGMVNVFDRARQPFGSTVFVTPPPQLLPVPVRG